MELHEQISKRLELWDYPNTKTATALGPLRAVRTIVNADVQHHSLIDGSIQLIPGIMKRIDHDFNENVEIMTMLVILRSG